MSRDHPCRWHQHSRIEALEAVLGMADAMPGMIRMCVTVCVNDMYPHEVRWKGNMWSLYIVLLHCSVTLQCYIVTLRWYIKPSHGSF